MAGHVVWHAQNHREQPTSWFLKKSIKAQIIWRGKQQSKKLIHDVCLTKKNFTTLLTTEGHLNKRIEQLSMHTCMVKEVTSLYRGTRSRLLTQPPPLVRNTPPTGCRSLHSLEYSSHWEDELWNAARTASTQSIHLAERDITAVKSVPPKPTVAVSTSDRKRGGALVTKSAWRG